MRFEEPSSMVRWDSPLFTIAYDEEPPYDAIWESITKGAKAPPTAAVKMVREARRTLAIPMSRCRIVEMSRFSGVSFLPERACEMRGHGMTVVMVMVVACSRHPLLPSANRPR